MCAGVALTELQHSYSGANKAIGIEQQLLLQQLAIEAIPAVGRQLDLAATIQFHPREMAPGPAAGIDSMAGNTGGIEIDGALPVPLHGAALPGSMPQAMVHVAKNHQVQGPLLADQANRFLQVLIAPITGRTFPITAAEISGVTP